MTDRHAAPRRARMERCARLPFASPLPYVGLALAACLAGCGAFAPEPIHPPPPPPPAQNSTPQGAILRLQRAYGYQDLTDYASLLTADFRYTFSAQSDPKLVSTYGNNWGKDDEYESAKHLLTGFTNTQGVYVPPASRIVVQFVNDQYYPDPAHADSGAWYVYCPVTDVNLTIDVPVGGGDVTTYDISAPHAFYLVRGDAAFLDPGQPADSTHWYVRHWDDLSPAPPVAAATWGGMRGAYER